MKRIGSYYVYIVKCKGGTYYTGITNDLEKRIGAHNTGCGAKYLRGKTPVKLVYAKKYRNYKLAADEERRIKTLTHAEKKALAGK